jgi:curved DNA-binding protein
MLHMEFRDYYKALGVARDATLDEIKRAFRKAARKYHPDINKAPEAEKMFKDVNEAYEVLKDPEKRAAYDQLGQEPPKGSGQYKPPPNWDSGYQFSNGGPDQDAAFSDFFETLFRRGEGASEHMHQSRGSDSHAKLQIDIEDAFKGNSRTLTLQMPVVGQDGSVSVQDRKIVVHIPKGISEGQHIRLAGQGSPTRGGDVVGDLFLEVAFAPHPIYRAEGRDLHLDLPVAPWEAALGGHVVMPTPGGKVDLRIPENARNGQKLRLNGKGVPGTPAGNIYATLKIVNPKVSTDQARAFFQTMAKEMSFDPRAHIGG